MSTITANPPLRLVNSCVHCNAELEISARFCGECGAPGEKARGQRSPQAMPAFAQTSSQYAAANLSPHPYQQQGIQNSSQTAAQSASSSSSNAVHHLHSAVNAGKGTHGSNVTPISQNLHVVPQASHLRPVGTPHSRAQRPPAPQPQQQPQQIPSFAEFHNFVPQEMKDELGQLVVLLARERIFLVIHCSVFLIANLLGFWIAMTAYHEYVADELTKLVISLVPMMVINSLAMACLSPIKGTRAEIARLKEKISYVRFQIDYRSFFNK